MFKSMKSAPIDRNILLLCKSFRGEIIVEGYWHVNHDRGANPWNTEDGFWRPFTGCIEITSSEDLNPFGWDELPTKEVTP